MGHSGNTDVRGIIENGDAHKSSYKYPQRYLGQARSIRIVMVGAGVTGIAAVKLYKDTFPEREVEFVIYEKNHDITGTWLENRYPG
jgi:hypothetical protein